MPKLTKEELSLLKENLEKLERSLALEVKELDKPPDMGSDVDEFEEKGEETEQFGVNLGIEEITKKRLESVRDALEKIRKGMYGVCVSCGQNIEREVLASDPESELCERCKKNKKK